NGAWDARRLTIVLRALLDSALASSPIGECVMVEIQAANGWATIVVRDHGPCIPAEVLPHIFEPFSGGRDSPNYGELGLGVPTARLIVEQYAGVLDVDSDEVAGNSFTVRLPL